MRERLNQLLARQYELGLQRSAAARAEYVKVSIEILNLTRNAVVDFSPDWKPPATIVRPFPARKSIISVEDLVEAKERLARIKREQGNRWFDEYRDLENQIRACEGGILERAQRGSAA